MAATVYRYGPPICSISDEAGKIIDMDSYDLVIVYN